MNVEPNAPTERGPQDWFTGEVWIDPVTAGHGSHRLSLGNVRFAPGARTAWHTHSIAQTLHVTQGNGFVQARGEAVINIRSGDIVNVAGGEWHWHGATPDHFMTHLSLTEGETEWGEQVSDAAYRSK